MVAWKDGSSACVVIDPGFYETSEKNEFFSFLDNRGLKPSAVLVTHAHADHIFGTRDVQDRFGGIPVYMDDREMMNLAMSVTLASKLGLREPDASFKTCNISDGDVVSEAGFRFKVISTPGHSPGGVCFLEEDEKIMFTGDTLFAGTIGRTDLNFSDYDDEIRSIMEKLVILPGDIRIFPGHGGESTIGCERENNPFLEPFNEAEESPSDDVKPVIISADR